MSVSMVTVPAVAACSTLTPSATTSGTAVAGDHGDTQGFHVVSLKCADRCAGAGRC